jgi:hypothetical protein
MADKKLAQEKVQADAEALSQIDEELKKTVDQLVAQVPSLVNQVKHLDNKVIDLLTELQARELCLERTTIANDDLQH